MGASNRGWRRLAAAAVARPPIDEPLDPERIRPVWALARGLAVFAALFDVALWVALRGDPHINAAALDRFVAINLPCLALMLGLGVWGAGREVGKAPVIAFLALAQFTVIVWIQATGSLSSYFLVAAALAVAAHRALLSWSLGVISLALLVGMHVAAVGLEELGALSRVPLFVAEPGPVYATTGFRAVVMASIIGVYAAAWMGTNVLIATLRTTQRALGAAERRLAAAAAGVREGRLTGQVVVGYRLLEVLGRGGMAEVYRGVRAGDDDAPVAVKVVHPHLVDDPALLARVRREARLAARLPASVTATVREVHLGGPGERVVVMTYLHGEDLASRLRRHGRMPLEEGVALCVAIARTVAQIHAAGIVHRDLKPHNVIVLDDSSPRVLDFGIARATDDEPLTEAADVLGTVGYMAPEMTASGAAAVGPAADVYALGVIALQVLTGVRAGELGARGGQRPAPRVRVHAPDVPAAVDAVVAKAMARTPARRYATAAAFADDLERALAGTLPVDVVRDAGRDDDGALADTFVARGGTTGAG